MKKLLILLVFLLVAGIGYFSYEKWVKHSNITAWSFVPVDAALVFEVDLLNDYNTLKGYPVWKNLGQTDGFSRINKSVSFLDSLNGVGGFEAIFKDAPTLISMHKVSNQGFDFLFVLEIQNISQNTFVGASIGRLQEKGYRFKTRNYNGFKISEVSKDGEVFACIFYKNYLLASFTPYLVEDAIRTIEGDQIPFERVYLGAEGPQSQDLFQVHTNYSQTSSLISSVSAEKIDLPFKNGDYTVSVDSSFITVSGFSYSEQSWMSSQKTQPASFDMAEIIPENTAYMYHITSADMTRWKQRHMDYLETNEPKIKALQDSLKRLFDFNADQVLDLVDEEIALVRIETGTERDQRRLCILELNDAQESLSFLQNLTERVSQARGDSVYTESYSESEIRYLPIKDFPQTFLGSIAGSFEQCFYINFRNYLILSNNLQELKSVISSIQEEDTWGKSLRVNEFLQRTNNTANVSLFVNIPRALNIIQNNISDTWKDHLSENLITYQNFEYAAFQFSYLDDRFFTNFTFSQPIQKSNSIPKTNAESGLRFASNLIVKPHLLKTHAYKDFDILVQDSTNAIYYLNPQQNTLWTVDVEDKIISNIFPIDYYRNGKIQYAFATKSNVHILDRTGQPIPEFPKSMSNITIDHFNVIDYDRSRNYRFAISDESGNTYLTDKELRPLDGWNPKNFSRASLKPLIHKRLGRRDIMISAQQNGVINVTNRRGENMRGFPFDTKQSLDKNYFIKTSNGLENSTITLISTSGELIEMTMQGDVIQRNQLIKTTPEATFQLVPDINNKSFLIIRKEDNKYEVLDDTGNLLFRKDYFAGSDIKVQYYGFGAGRDLVVFVDTSSQSLYIYDKSGNLLTGNPLRSAHEVSILYSSVKREFQVFTTWGSNLELYSFSY